MNIKSTAEHDGLDPRFLASPEARLNWLNSCLLKLFSHAFSNAALKRDSDNISQLRDLMRRTVTAELLFERDYLAVAGAQGAGKSTFVKNLLGLDSDVLITNQGRGEKLPLFITLNPDPSVLQICRFVRRFEDVEGVPTLKTHEVFSTDEELTYWRKVQQGGDTNALITELVLPQSQVNEDSLPLFDGGAGIMLLPGYELNRDNAQINYFLTLMRDALAQSSYVLLVTTESDLANRVMGSILEDLEKRLPGVDPVVIVSSAESMSDSTKADLVETVNSKFAVKNSEAAKSDSRVVFSPDPAGTSVLSAKLLLALSVTTNIDYGVQRERQLAALYKVLDQLQILLETFDELASEKSAELAVGNSEKVFKEVQVFRESASDLRNVYYESVKASLAERAASATETALNRHERDRGGVWNWVRTRGESVGKEERSYNSIIFESWNSSLDDKEPYGVEHSKVLRNAVTKRLQGIGVLDLFPSDDIFDRMLNGGNAVDSSPELKYFTDNLEFILSPSLKDVVRAEINDDYKRALQALPMLALAYSDLFWSTDTHHAFANASEISRPEVALTKESLMNQFQLMSETQKKVVGIFGSILLADFALDGTINSVPALVNGVHTILIGSSATAGTAGAASAAHAGFTVAGVSVAGALAAVAGLATISAAIHQHVKRTDFNSRNGIRISIANCNETYFDAYMKAFDGFMNHVEEMFQTSLGIRYNLDQAFVTQIKLDKSLSDARIAVQKMLEEIPPITALSD